MDVGVPARPLVAGMIRLRMNLRGNRLQTDHHAVPADKGPEIFSVAVTASLISNLETELGLVEVEARLKIVDNKARSNAVERGHGPMVARGWLLRSRAGMTGVCLNAACGRAALSAPRRRSARLREMAALPRLSSCAAPKEMLFVRAKMSVEGTHAMRSARGEFLEAPLLIQSESRSFDSARTSVPEVLAALRMAELS